MPREAHVCTLLMKSKEVGRHSPRYGTLHFIYMLTRSVSPANEPRDSSSLRTLELIKTKRSSPTTRAVHSILEEWRQRISRRRPLRTLWKLMGPSILYRIRAVIEANTNQASQLWRRIWLLLLLIFIARIPHSDLSTQSILRSMNCSNPHKMSCFTLTNWW